MAEPDTRPEETDQEVEQAPGDVTEMEVLIDVARQAIQDMTGFQPVLSTAIAQTVATALEPYIAALVVDGQADAVLGSLLQLGGIIRRDTGDEQQAQLVEMQGLTMARHLIELGRARHDQEWPGVPFPLGVKTEPHLKERSGA